MPTVNPNIYITGFGGDGEKVNSDLIDKKSTSVGTFLTSNPMSNDNINYCLDSIGGHSGGPIYIKNSDGTKTIIGIHHGSMPSYSAGVRIRTSILNFVYNNDNLSY